LLAKNISVRTVRLLAQWAYWGFHWYTNVRICTQTDIDILYCSAINQSINQTIL